MELLLIPVALAALGAPIVLLLHHRKGERVAAEDAKRAFAERVDRYFAEKRVGRLNLLRLAEKAGVSETDARVVGREKYEEMVSLALSDGRLSESEERKLSKLAEALHVDGGEKAAAEHGAKMRAVDAEVADILADGRVSEDESDRLHSLAERLGLTDAEVQRRAADAAGRAFTDKISIRYSTTATSRTRTRRRFGGSERRSDSARPKRPASWSGTPTNLFASLSPTWPPGRASISTWSKI